MSELVTPKIYLLTLCTAVQESGKSLGIAVRIGSSNSMFNVEASKVIHGILTFSPAPDSMAVEFLNELEKVHGMRYLVAPVVHRTCQSDPITWTMEVMDFIFSKFRPEERINELKPVTNLASEMLSHLLIATRNPGGKKTPQESVLTTFNVEKLLRINELLVEATTNRSQSALKDLLFARDGLRCPFTDLRFAPPGRHLIARAAHILPFSFHNKVLTLSALESFSGRQLAKEVKENINHPCNAFNAESNAHDSYDKLAWGIEAIEVDNQWKYFFREVRPNEVSATIKLTEGQEILFGQGVLEGQGLAKPNPEFCNLKLAIARVTNACGAADIIAKMYGDEDDGDIITQPVYMGGPFVSDDVLLRRLDDRLLA